MQKSHQNIVNPRDVAANAEEEEDSNSTECISRVPFHVKHAQLR